MIARVQLLREEIVKMRAQQTGHPFSSMEVLPGTPTHWSELLDSADEEDDAEQDDSSVDHNDDTTQVNIFLIFLLFIISPP
jgi:hypothetical protein